MSLISVYQGYVTIVSLKRMNSCFPAIINMAVYGSHKMITHILASLFLKCATQRGFAYRSMATDNSRPTLFQGPDRCPYNTGHKTRATSSGLRHF